MTHEPIEPTQDDILDLATEAMRNVEVPPPPRGELPGRFQPMPAHGKAAIWARFYRPGLAIAVLVITGVAVWSLSGNSRAVFADAVQRLRESQTISFRSTIKGEGFPDIVTRQTMSEPGLVRTRMQMGGKHAGISIFDGKKSTGIILMPATKQAIKMTSSDDLPGRAAQSREFIEWLKSTREHAVEDLGPRKIDGVATFGFRVEKEGQPWDVWVDVKSNLPVRIDSRIEIAGIAAAVVMDEFVFDEELHPSLFSLTPPTGYTVTDELDAREPSEDDVVEFLEYVAEMTDGRFPPDLQIQTLTDLAKNTQEKSMKEALQNALKITRALMFVQMNKVAYTGKGVTLGDRERIVCWWTPAGQQTFRAVYGDLTIRNGATKEPPVAK